MRLGRAHNGDVEHPRQHHVVGVHASAGDQRRILLAPQALADVAAAVGALRGGAHAPTPVTGIVGSPGDGAGSASPRCGALAADSTALTMLWYPVHRQRLPASASRTSVSEGSGFCRRRSVAAMLMPGVRYHPCPPCCP